MMRMALSQLMEPAECGGCTVSIKMNSQMSVDGEIMMRTHNYLLLDVCGWRIQIIDAYCHITIDRWLLNVVDALFQ